MVCEVPSEGDATVQCIQPVEYVQEDYRLDYGVAEACEPDVVTFCSAEKGLAHGNAEVLKCLVKVRQGTIPAMGSSCEGSSVLCMFSSSQDIWAVHEHSPIGLCMFLLQSALAACGRM